MGIEYLARKGMACPMVFCDHCGEQMGPKDHILWWIRQEDGDRWAPSFAHKGQCTRAMDAKNGGSSWEPLAWFLTYLASNSKVDVPKEMSRIKALN